MTSERGIWEVAVLALLREAPMHPYQMQSLLQTATKTRSLRSNAARSITLSAGSRATNSLRPTLRTAMADAPNAPPTHHPCGPQGIHPRPSPIIAVPRREPSEFMAAMSFLVHLTPAEAPPSWKSGAGIWKTKLRHQAGDCRRFAHSSCGSTSSKANTFWLWSRLNSPGSEALPMKCGPASSHGISGTSSKRFAPHTRAARFPEE